VTTTTSSVSISLSGLYAVEEPLERASMHEDDEGKFSRHHPEAVVEIISLELGTTKT